MDTLQDLNQSRRNPLARERLGAFSCPKEAMKLALAYMPVQSGADHSAGVAHIARALNASLDGAPIDADALAFACRTVGVDFASAVFALANARLVVLKGDQLFLGPLGHALLVSAYIG